MKQSEIERIKNFYKLATADQQCDIRGFIGIMYGTSHVDAFRNAGYTNKGLWDFSGTTEKKQDVPESIWQLLEQDDSVKDFEDLTARGILSLYDMYINENNFGRKLIGDLNRKHGLNIPLEAEKAIQRVLRGKPAEGIIEEEAEPTEKFSLDEQVEYYMEKLPILNEKRLREHAVLLIKMRESELMSPGGEHRKG